MYLDVVDHNGCEPEVFSGGSLSEFRPVYSRWKDWAPTSIMHHGGLCCEIAREWLTSFDSSVLNGASPMTGPRWLGSRFPWGPVQYPIAWCEVIKKDVLDCGVHAALAHEVFRGRGVRSYRLQIVQEYSPAAATQWHAVWADEAAVTDWISGSLIYHEGAAVQMENGELKLWDSSAGWWIDPETISGYGSIRAVRITCPQARESLAWKDRIVIANIWNELK